MNRNFQAAARQADDEQDRDSYRDVTTQLGLLGLDPAIPDGVRDLAQKSVAHAREDCNSTMDAFDASVAAFERSFAAAGRSAAAFDRKFIDSARRDVNSSFDSATSLAGAKGLYDMVKLRAARWREQLDELRAQAKNVRALSVETTEPGQGDPE